MATSDDQKEEIKSRIDLGDLVSSYGYQLKQSGGDLWCCCPFHNEKTPSFKVDVSRGTYHCFGCGESGDVFSFVMKQEGLSFHDALQKLAGAAGIELKSTVSKETIKRRKLYDLMTTLSSDFNTMLHKSKAAETAREYLKKRKLDNEIADKFMIGYAPESVDKILSWGAKHNYTVGDLAAAGVIKISDTEGKKPYFYFANRLVFTIKDKNGQVVAFSGRQLVEDKKSGKYINSPETAIFKKSRTFFAYDEARKHIVKATNREAIICEGQIDCIRLHANGYNTAVAPLGTAFTEDHASLLHKVADTAILCFDDDLAGHKATIRAAQLLLAEGMPVRVISLPDGDDPDSYILKHGRDAFGKLISDKAESIVKFQIRSERAKEQNPEDSSAAVRVAKAVLETIAKCKDKVVRNVLLKDAANGLGMEYYSLESAIEKEVKTATEENIKVSEQLIEEPIAGRAEDVARLPNVVEGAFLNYLLANEGNDEIKECVGKLIPTSVIQSPMASRILDAYMKNRKGDEDPLRDVVESLSTDEYRAFISIMSNLESTWVKETSHKNNVVYFARQIWGDWLASLVKSGKYDGENLDYIVNAIRTIHTATKKGVVHMISTFDKERFAK